MIRTIKNLGELMPHIKQLGITEEDCANCLLDWQQEAETLVDAGLDIFDRPQKMTLNTYQAWLNMIDEASNSGVDLQLVSAYRSINYQIELIEKKIASGRRIEDILSVNAIPGFSEHHTGRALDLTTGGFEPLTIAFETSPAFSWLRDNAAQFNFSLSYPRGNQSGISYEPWHWAFKA